MFLLKFLFIELLFSVVVCSLCSERFYAEQNMVCVCNSTYCDELNLVSDIPPDKAALYETNAAGSRFESSFVKFSPKFDPNVPIVRVNSSEKYQFILGFGGAFTDAAGINVQSLPLILQKKLLQSYFAKSGLQYNMGRIPIASCDFSTHAYSYDDFEGDFQLVNFSLTKEDHLFKIPFIHMAQSIMDEQKLLLVGSPWSAPAWMKTNGEMKGQGGLKGDPGDTYHTTWANYLIKFVQAYSDNNITMWGLTLQNEPTDGCIADFRFQAMCFPPEDQREFIKKNLGPSLQIAGLTPDKLRLLIVDDARIVLPRWADVILNDPEAAQFVSGIGYHWYYEDFAPHKLLDVTHGLHPDYFLLSTEACTGSYPWEFPKVDLGSWTRAERYAHDIVQDLSHWSIGWIDWNLALDLQGGPNWVHNYVDAAIIVDASRKEFLKQPMYYVIAHFSKCIPRGSIRIGSKLFDGAENLLKKIDMVIFLTPQYQIVVVIVNRNEHEESFFLQDPLKGYLNVTLLPHSIQTYIW